MLWTDVSLTTFKCMQSILLKSGSRGRMITAEGAIAQRMISKLLIVLMVESGAVNRLDAIEVFRAARARIAATVRDVRLRNCLITELDEMVRALDDASGALH